MEIQHAVYVELAPGRDFDELVDVGEALWTFDLQSHGDSSPVIRRIAGRFARSGASERIPTVRFIHHIISDRKDFLMPPVGDDPDFTLRVIGYLIIPPIPA